MDTYLFLLALYFLFRLASRIFRLVYDGLFNAVKPQSVPKAVITLADYQYKAAFVADAELNMVACLTELMVDLEYK